jgi:hypothetical protein
VDGRKPDGANVANAYGYPGRVAVVGREPLLEALLTTNGLVQLILYAAPGTTNVLQTATQLPATGAWSSGQTVVTSNIVTQFPPLAPTNRTLFIRAVRP